jgi:hypothetical protein
MLDNKFGRWLDTLAGVTVTEQNNHKMSAQEVGQLLSTAVAQASVEFGIDYGANISTGQTSFTQRYE